MDMDAVRENSIHFFVFVQISILIKKIYLII